MGFFEIKNLLTPHKSMDFDKASVINQNARGVPVPTAKSGNCKGCTVCVDACPTKAIQVHSDKEIEFDYGACIQCGLCTEVCPDSKIENSGLTYVLTLNRNDLKVKYKNGEFEPVDSAVSDNIVKFRKMTFGQGFNYREVAAAGNNSVECELNASFNNFFDSEGQQFRAVASPKHADTVLYSGPVSENMEHALDTAWDCMPEPKALIACGTEAISGGVFPKGKVPKEPDLFIGGDPPRPDVIINGFRYLIGVYKYSFQEALKKRINELRQI